MPYKLNYKRQALDDLSKLSQSNAQRISDKLNWLAANLDNIKPKMLTGSFKGSSKIHIGDYRAIYSIKHSPDILVVQTIGHRSDIYRRSKEATNATG